MGTGKLTLRLGSWDTGATTFTPADSSSDINIDIGAADATLQGVRDKINAANAGVTASIVTDTSGSRLAIRSNSTGAVNGFRLQAAEDAPGTASTPGLSALAYDPPGGTSAGVRVQNASNSQAQINGIDVSSVDNTFSSVVEGVTFTANKVSTTPATVTVALNTDSIKGLVAKFVGAYNSVSTFIASQTGYDASTKTGGLFQGDSAILSVQNQMRSLLGQQGTGSSTFSTFSSLGVQLQKDGTVTLNDAVLSTALKNPTEVAKALAGTSVATASTTSLAKRFSSWGDSLLGIGGALPSRTASFQKQIAANQQQQIVVSDRLTALENRLRAQYAALDQTVSASSSLNSFVTRQFAVKTSN